jgi:phytoene synthase
VTQALALTGRADLVACRQVIAQHSRSFALASTLLGPVARDHAAAVYAWCRGADDAIDLAPADRVAAALAEERAELERIYSGAPRTLAGRAFAAVVAERRIPRAYPAALLDGMAMDVADTRYDTDEDLFTYCYRVAGVVGLIMCHVLGLSDDRALVPATHLGIAMQLTNICRDVGEDWQRGRLYLPDTVLAAHGLGGLHARLGTPLAPSCTRRCIRSSGSCSIAPIATTARRPAATRPCPAGPRPRSAPPLGSTARSAPRSAGAARARSASARWSAGSPRPAT